MSSRSWIGLIVLAALASVAGCGGTTAAGVGGDVSRVYMTDQNTFSPQVITVRPGTDVMWTNQGHLDHQVENHSNMMMNGPMSNSMFPQGMHNGQSFVYHVPENTPPGTHIYYNCPAHGSPGEGSHMGAGMAGEIIVR